LRQQTAPILRFVAMVVVFVGPCIPALAQTVPRVTAGRLRVELDRIIDQPQATDLYFPLYVTTAHDGSDRLFFAEKGTGPGTNVRIRVRDNATGIIRTFLNLIGEAISTSERGLLGLAFHPGYADPLSPGYRKLYTYHSVPINAGATVDFTSNVAPISHHNLVTEWQVSASDPNLVDISTRREIFREAHPSDIHNAGTLTFGPDGYLYGSIGTAPTGTLQLLTSQDNSDILGTIFRIDPLDPSLTPTSTDPISANGKYRIPANNPFVNDPTALDEIFAYGLRNPYRFSVDPVTGLVFAGDVGQGSREEVDVVPLGGNMGWPYMEGTKLGPVTMPNPAPTLVAPIAEYTHADGRAIVGGHVYRGSIPALEGKYVFGDFTDNNGNFFAGTGRLFYIDPFDAEGEINDPANIRIREIMTAPATCAQTLNSDGACTFDAVLMAFGVDDDNELYAVGIKGGKAVVYKFTDAYLLPEGDYNEDGVVDAADFTLWRDTLGQTVGFGSEADGDGSGVIDMADYDVWKMHFGETTLAGAGSSSGAGSGVPEPTTLLLAMIGFLAAGWARRRSRRRRSPDPF
jgi:glucose/arabinose dehydrogenase